MKPIPADLERYIQHRCATDPAFKEAYDARKLKDHYLEGTLFIIYTLDGVMQMPIDTDNIHEAVSYAKTFKLDIKTNGIRLIRYTSGIWIEVESFRIMLSGGDAI